MTIVSLRDQQALLRGIALGDYLYALNPEEGLSLEKALKIDTAKEFIKKVYTQIPQDLLTEQEKATWRTLLGTSTLDQHLIQLLQEATRDLHVQQEISTEKNTDIALGGLYHSHEETIDASTVNWSDDLLDLADTADDVVIRLADTQDLSQWLVRITGLGGNPFDIPAGQWSRVVVDNPQEGYSYYSALGGHTLGANVRHVELWTRARPTQYAGELTGSIKDGLVNFNTLTTALQKRIESAEITLRTAYNRRGNLVIGLDGPTINISPPSEGKEFRFIQFEGLYGYDADWDQANPYPPENQGHFSGLYSMQGNVKTSTYSGENSDGVLHRGGNRANSQETYAIGVLSKGNPPTHLATVEYNPTTRQISIAPATFSLFPTPPPQVSGGSGDGAEISAIATDPNGYGIISVFFSSGGIGYLAGDVITLTQAGHSAEYTVLAEDLDVDGAIQNLLNKDIKRNFTGANRPVVYVFTAFVYEASI